MVDNKIDMEDESRTKESLIEESYPEELIARAKEVFAKFIEICPSKEITEEDLEDWDAYEDEAFENAWKEADINMEAEALTVEEVDNFFEKVNSVKW